MYFDFLTQFQRFWLFRTLLARISFGNIVIRSGADAEAVLSYLVLENIFTAALNAENPRNKEFLAESSGNDPFRSFWCGQDRILIKLKFGM